MQKYFFLRLVILPGMLYSLKIVFKQLFTNCFMGAFCLSFCFRYEISRTDTPELEILFPPDERAEVAAASSDNPIEARLILVCLGSKIMMAMKILDQLQSGIQLSRIHSNLCNQHFAASQLRPEMQRFLVLLLISWLMYYFITEPLLLVLHLLFGEPTLGDTWAPNRSKG